MAQSISLNDLLNFQNSNNPVIIANYLSNTNEWVTDHSDFSDPRQSYKWYKANEGEEFESSTKDQLSYYVMGSFEPSVVYFTADRASFDAINASIATSDMTQIESKNVPDVGGYVVYASADQVIQVIEPLVANDKGRLNYGFMVFKKVDYEKGFRIK